MSSQLKEAPTAFGQQLKMWRRQRGLSQLQLASAASTTPRHLSFIESGRSRPGRDLILRLAQCLDLSIRNQNSLLISAGLPPEFAQRELESPEVSPYRAALDLILDRHNPYPACAFNSLGKVLRCNEAHRKFAPGCEEMTPEESIDTWLGPGPNRKFIDNFSEVAWAWIDRKIHEAAQHGDPELTALVERALNHLADTPRPNAPTEGYPDVVSPRFRVGDKIIRTFATVMRFESAREVTLSELRVELIFPLDDESDQFFRDLCT